MIWNIYQDSRFVGVGRGATAVEAIDDWRHRQLDRGFYLKGPFSATRTAALEVVR